jgi:hypothetical protein
MEILDRYFLRMPKKKQAFIMLIGSSFFIIGVAGFIANLTNLTESFLFVVIGIFCTEIMKLQYRIEDLEKRKGK